MADRFRRLTLLHSNDMHGDFLAEQVDENLVGGVSMLSGYISKVKEEEENVIYCVAGDMFRGSVIDSEFKGVSTIEIMNMLSPDVVTIGNHETDYGLPHLLFIEKCARFPIINANLSIKMNGVRLFKPYHIVEIGGMKILFIGILTEDVMDTAKGRGDDLITGLVDVNDAAQEIAKIINAFKGVDIDFTVLLTHIGIEQDKKLAAALDPELGVDVIIGGHSHTFMDEPVKVNDILIVQAGTGTDQIGRFDIVVDTDNNNIYSYQWQSVPIEANTCPKDNKMEELIGNLKSQTDMKYGHVLRRLNVALTHPNRFKQTELGSFVSDVFKQSLKLDVYLGGSGAIRLTKLGPIITLQDMMSCYPYIDKIAEFTLTGKKFKELLTYTYRDEVFEDSDSEFYQLSEGMYVEYDYATKQIVRFEKDGLPIKDDEMLKVGIREYDYRNSKKFFNMTLDELQANEKMRILTNSSIDVLYENLTSAEKLPKYPDSTRLVILNK